MTPSRQLILTEVIKLECTPDERSALISHIYDHDLDNIKNSTHARHYLEIALTLMRDGAAEEAAAPKWRELPQLGMEYCKAPSCTKSARWEIETMIEDWLFVVYACDRHAGKEEG